MTLKWRAKQIECARIISSRSLYSFPKRFFFASFFFSKKKEGLLPAVLFVFYARSVNEVRMIVYRQVDLSYLSLYDTIPMLVHVSRALQPRRLQNGLGGMLFDEIEVEPYTKNLGAYSVPSQYGRQHNISGWGFYMAFDGNKPVAAATIAAKTKTVRMLENREDISVLWDLRVTGEYKGQRIGTKLFALAVAWSKENGLRQMKIECQTNNVPACTFYAKQGAVLRAINEYAYIHDTELKEHEMQLLWYLDL